MDFESRKLTTSTTRFAPTRYFRNRPELLSKTVFIFGKTSGAANTMHSKVCSDGLPAFRYVRILLDALAIDSPYASPDGRVDISSVGLCWSRYLGTPPTFIGWFECSDANFTQWWFGGIYTVDIGADIFWANDTDPRDATSASLLNRLVRHDGAKRDRHPYMGDLAVHQRADGWILPANIDHYTFALFD
ncbi:hypothetical protein ANO14919_144260 [Xylariales sp. No.14919]|nr:hypothetical protein ANO14919_144260 [Xylariales sp. No.14919]